MLYFAMQVKFGIEFKGGLLLTVPLNQSIDLKSFEADLTTNFELEDLKIRATSGTTAGLFIEFSGEKNLLNAQTLIEQKKYEESIEILKKTIGELNISGEPSDKADIYYSKAREEFKNNLIGYISQKLNIDRTSFSIKDVGPSLGSFFLGQAQTAMIFAFVLMSCLVFYYYRTPLICFAVVQAAGFDAFFGYASLGIFGIPLSLASIAPLLMLIGYSVDTDIMLTDRVLKRKAGKPADRAWGALKTGLTMTFTTIGALIALSIISSYANIEVLRNISIILLIGLVGDLFATWCTNTVIVLWIAEKKIEKG